MDRATATETVDLVRFPAKSNQILEIVMKLPYLTFIKGQSEASTMCGRQAVERPKVTWQSPGQR